MRASQTREITKIPYSALWQCHSDGSFLLSLICRNCSMTTFIAWRAVVNWRTTICYSGPRVLVSRRLLLSWRTSFLHFHPPFFFSFIQCLINNQNRRGYRRLLLWTRSKPNLNLMIMWSQHCRVKSSVSEMLPTKSRKTYCSSLLWIAYNEVWRSLKTSYSFLLFWKCWSKNWYPHT